MNKNTNNTSFKRGLIEYVRAEELHGIINSIIHEIELFGSAKLITNRSYVTAALVPIHSPECLKNIVNRASSCQRCLEHQPEPYIIR